MMQFDSWWFPDGETQLPEEMAKHNVRVDGRLTWQYHKYAAALSLLPLDRRRVAVDVGAHVGLWSYWMIRDFGEVHAFEPLEAHRVCWKRNMNAGLTSYLHPVALGDCEGRCDLIAEPGSSGGAHIYYHGDVGRTEQRTLDSFELRDVDLIKIDVEGFASAVIDGARDTLLRCRPIVIVEEALWSRYGFDGPPGIDLERLGMKYRTALGPDKIYEW